MVFARWRQCALVEGHVAVTCRITLNHRCTAAMRLMANYFDHLLYLDTPTYTVAQIAKRFEPSTVLWAFHTIQPSSYQCICSHCFLLEYDQQTPLNALCSLLIKLCKCSDKFSKLNITQLLCDLRVVVVVIVVVVLSPETNKQRG